MHEPTPAPKADPAARRLPPEERRQLILEAARSVIAAKGLAAVGVREIAAEAGVSSGTVTHHFASIDEILAGVLRAESEHFRGALQGMLRSRGSALEGLFAIVERLLSERDDAFDYWSLWLDYWARAAHDSAMAEWQSDRYRAWRELVRDLIAEGIERGEFKPVDPERTAIELVALIDGLAIQAFFERNDVTPEAAAELLCGVMRIRLLSAPAVS